MGTHKWNNKSHSSYNQEKIAALESIAGEKIDDLIEHLNLDLRKSDRFYVGPCPIHGGDKKNAFNIFHTGDDIVGNWRCFTNGCEKHFLPSLTGFIRAYISHTKYGWSCGKDDDKICPFNEAVEFLQKFTKTGSLDDLQINGDLEQRRFVRNVNNIFYTSNTHKNTLLNIPRETAIKTLEIPATYFKHRLFSHATLIKYDVGLCKDPTKEMYNRCVVPIYDDNHKNVIGCTGRIIFEKCPLCKFHHNPLQACPRFFSKANAKWIHNDGFPAENYLYNYWFAKEHIKESGFVVLTESPGNVWRLEEAGIHNAVGTFGAHLTPKQRLILDKSGALCILVLMDNDSAGRSARDNIIKELSKTYRVFSPDINRDIGDMEPLDLKRELKEIIEQIKRSIM